MSEPIAETSTEPSPFDAAPVTYEPPVAERRQLADDAMEILLRGRQRTVIGTTKVSAEEIVTLAEYLRTGRPLSPDTSPTPYTLVDVKTVAPGDVFLYVGDTEAEILGPPRIDFQSVKLKVRVIKTGDVYNPTYDPATQLRIVRREPVEPVDISNTEEMDIGKIRVGDVVLVSGWPLKTLSLMQIDDTLVEMRVQNLLDPARIFPFVWKRPTQVQVVLPRPEPLDD